MYSYPVFLEHYIDLFWECGSAVGAGRGSAGAGLNHMLLGITQVDPVKNDLPYWRYMNHDTNELGDEQLQRLPVGQPA
jgi:DNA polymerase-3 subunit alpha